MEKDDQVCICHRVSLGKLCSFLEREDPKVASQLSQCLDSGTSCGWCIPFLKKLHSLYVKGLPMNIDIDMECYKEQRVEFNKNKRINKKADE